MLIKRVIKDLKQSQKVKDKLKIIWIHINYWPRRKWRQIKNVVGWIRLVWNHYDFDYKYSIEVFKYQLLKQARLMESEKACLMDAKTNAQKIRMVVRLMDKVYDEEYACEYQQRLKDKYGEDVNDFIFLEVPGRKGSKQLKLKYEVDEKYESLRDEIRENSDKWFEESHEKQERAHKLLYKLLEFYIRDWWD